MGDAAPSFVLCIFGTLVCALSSYRLFDAGQPVLGWFFVVLALVCTALVGWFLYLRFGAR